MFGQLHIWPKSMGYHVKMFFGRNIQDFPGISKRYASKTSCDTTLTTPKPMLRPIDLFMMWPDSYCIYYPYIHTHTTYICTYFGQKRNVCIHFCFLFLLVLYFSFVMRMREEFVLMESKLEIWIQMTRNCLHALSTVNPSVFFIFVFIYVIVVWRIDFKYKIVT